MTMAAMGALQADLANQAVGRGYKWKKQMEEAGEKSAFLSSAIQQRQLGTQTQQKMRSVNEEIQMISRKGNQVAATAAVRATKGGLQADSTSVQALQQQFGKDAIQAIGVRDVEGQGILTFSKQQAKAIKIQTKSRIDSVQAGPPPDDRAFFANIIMGAAKGYMMGKTMEGGAGGEAGSQSLSIDPTYNPALAPPAQLPMNMPAGLPPMSVPTALPQLSPTPFSGANNLGSGPLSTLSGSGIPWQSPVFDYPPSFYSNYNNLWGGRGLSIGGNY
tara:strand:- start:465 stop:1286 length:822 start_codon:yes stop_codon:yes gene_type:complete